MSLDIYVKNSNDSNGRLISTLMLPGASTAACPNAVISKSKKEPTKANFLICLDWLMT